MGNLNWLDLALAAVVLLSVVVSLFRGFSREATLLVTWILAVWASIKYSSQVAAYMTGYIHAHYVRVVIAVGIIFIIVFVLANLLGGLINKLITLSGLRVVDYAFGVAFGAVRGLLIAAIIVMMGEVTPISNAKVWKESVVIPKLAPVQAWLRGFIPEKTQKELAIKASAQADAIKAKSH